MNLNRKHFYFIPFILAGLLAACKHEPGVIPGQPPVTGGTGGTGGGGGTGGTGNPPCDPSVIYFEKQILPILVSNCAMSGCHDPGTSQDGVTLNSYAAVMASDIIKAGNASNSDLIEVLTESDPDDRMPRPPANPLTADQINLIRTWINQGAKNIICNSGDCDTTVFTYSSAIKPILQNNCYGCHNTSLASGGINLSVYDGAKTVALNGKLFGAVNHEAGFPKMPQGGNKLGSCDITRIKKWINAGAPNN